MRRFYRRLLRRRPQLVPHQVHYPGMEMRILTPSGLLYQANCEQMRLSAKLGGADPIAGEWISLLNAPSLGIYFTDPIDVQIRPLPGVKGSGL